MAKKSRDAREPIIIECTEAREAGFSPSRYSTLKNRRNTPGRIEMKKYNPFMKRHTLHRELRK